MSDVIERAKANGWYLTSRDFKAAPRSPGSGSRVFVFVPPGRSGVPIFGAWLTWKRWAAPPDTSDDEAWRYAEEQGWLDE